MRREALILLACATAQTGCRDRAPAPVARNAPSASAPSSASPSSAPAPSAPPAPPAWPELPTTQAACEGLVARSTLRAPRDARSDEVTLETAIASAARRGWARQVVGDEAIRAAIERWIALADSQGRAAYLLFGTTHDSGAPIDAFRRLVGPGGARGVTHIVLEQLRADGAWSGVALAEQTGDGVLLANWLARGDATSFEALSRFHAEHDYAAWKLGYADRVMDVLVGARASGKPVVACDMPPSLQARVTTRPSALLDRVRELHCLFALRDAVARSTNDARDRPHVAMLWGEAHVAMDAFPRYLGAADAVATIHVFGRRAQPKGVDAPDRAIGGRVVLNDPVLVSLDDTGRERALLLPDDDADVDRVRRREPMDDPDSYVRVRADVVARFAIDDRAPVVIGTATTPIKISSGLHGYAIEVGDGDKRVTIVGVLDIPPAGAAELSFDRLMDPRKRSTHVEYVAPK